MLLDLLPAFVAPSRPVKAEGGSGWYVLHHAWDELRDERERTARFVVARRLARPTELQEVDDEEAVVLALVGLGPK